MSLVNKTIDIVTRAHDGQKYGDKPYVYHLLQVAHETGKQMNFDGVYSGDIFDKYQVVSYAHDLMEDCPEWTRDRLISEGFPIDVVDAIDAISKRSGESRISYLERVKLNPIAKFIKIRDSFVNLTQSLAEDNTKRIIKYSDNLRILHGG